MTNDWYSITVNSTDDPEILIYDRIGAGGMFESDGVTAQAFMRDLRALASFPRLTLRVNSPGGSVFDGMAIYHALRESPAHITAHIDGLAASIASIIALAADEVHMASGALMMIHDPMAAAQGNATDMRSAAAMLDRLTASLVDVYAQRTGWDEQKVRDAMTAETWFTAVEAVAVGLADTITGQLAAAATFDLSFLHPNNERNNPVSDTATPTAPPVAPPTAADTATAEALASLERRVAAISTAPRTAPSPLAAFASFAEYAQAVYRGDLEPVAVLADQITTDNPGVMPPSWQTEVRGIIDQARPAIEALGATPAGASGLDINWPYFDGDLAAIVAKQATEKTEVHSVKVSFKKGSATLETYGAASDVSYQLLMRSDPSYIDQMLRVYAAAYALTTDDAFTTALVAAAVAGAGYDFTADTDGKAFRSWAFAASLAVRRATGAPASVILVADDVFEAAGGWDALGVPAYGVQNVAGTAQASTLEVNVSGLPVVNDPTLPAGSILATNRQAATWVEDGPHSATAEDVAKLGRDYAIFGFGTDALYNVNGIVKPGVVTP